jgi:hypothetical protein
MPLPSHTHALQADDFTHDFLSSGPSFIKIVSPNGHHPSIVIKVLFDQDRIRCLSSMANGTLVHKLPKWYQHLKAEYIFMVYYCQVSMLQDICKAMLMHATQTLFSATLKLPKDKARNSLPAKCLPQFASIRSMLCNSMCEMPMFKYTKPLLDQVHLPQLMQGP